LVCFAELVDFPGDAAADFLIGNCFCFCFCFFMPWDPFVVVESVVPVTNDTDFAFLDGVWLSVISVRAFFAEWSGARTPDGFLLEL
jgi:hypothetical protein